MNTVQQDLRVRLNRIADVIDDETRDSDLPRDVAELLEDLSRSLRRLAVLRRVA
jgi:hypothetical protein